MRLTLNKSRLFLYCVRGWLVAYNIQHLRSHFTPPASSSPYNPSFWRVPMLCRCGKDCRDEVKFIHDDLKILSSLFSLPWGILEWGVPCGEDFDSDSVTQPSHLYIGKWHFSKTEEMPWQTKYSHLVPNISFVGPMQVPIPNVILPDNTPSNQFKLLRPIASHSYHQHKFYGWQKTTRILNGKQVFCALSLQGYYYYYFMKLFNLCSVLYYFHYSDMLYYYRKQLSFLCMYRKLSKICILQEERRKKSKYLYLGCTNFSAHI